MTITPRCEDPDMADIHLWHVSQGRLVVEPEHPRALFLRSGYAGEDMLSLKEAEKLLADLTDIVKWMRDQHRKPIDYMTCPLQVLGDEMRRLHRGEVDDEILAQRKALQDAIEARHIEIARAAEAKHRERKQDANYADEADPNEGEP